MANVQFARVRKSYGAVNVISEMDLTIADGSFTVLVGPSGCGKSTMLRMVAGLESASSGRILIGGEDVTHLDPSERGIAMVFQSYALYPHMTVSDNIGFGLKLAGVPKAEIESRIKSAASTLRLEKMLDRKPHQLSGGQRQRVAIGRAIVRQPKVFLFDEPLSNLDAALRSQMRMELSELHDRIGATMIYVTHDQVEAMTMADQIVALNGGQIEQVGAPATLYKEPATLFVAGFIGSPKMNFLEGSNASVLGGQVVGIRPEDIAISTQDGLWSGSIRHSEYLGSETLVYVDAGSRGTLAVKSTNFQECPNGTAVFLQPDLSKIHIFNNGVRAANAL